MPMRLDRLLTIYCAGPLGRLTGSSDQIKIPVLMYHSVSDGKENGHPYYRVNTSPAVFAAHMQWLRDQQYQVIPLEHVAERLQATDTSGVKYASITFDDGYRDFYTEAFPILQQYGFGATVFLTTGFTDSGSQFNKKISLRWEDIRELDRYGIHFGSHTVSHPKLINLERHQVICEIVDSKKNIEDKLGRPVSTFSYPYAFPESDRRFVEFLRSILQENGYSRAVTTSIGVARPRQDPFFLRRVPANAHDDPVLFSAKLAGSYDWLYAAQYLVKITKFLTGQQ